MSINRLFDPFQSAFRKFYSTETALNLVINDTLLTLDNQYCILLVLLDLSCAFDTIDHNIIMSHLSNIDITGVHIDCIKSYLTHHQFKYITLSHLPH